MYFHVLRLLSVPMMQKLGKLLSRPLFPTFYTDLKAELLNIAALSDKKEYAAISRDVELGDSKPSDPLSRFVALISNWSSWPARQ